MPRIYWPLLLGLVMAAAACAPAAGPPTEQPERRGEGQPVHGGVFTRWIGGDPPTFDSHQSNTYFTSDTAHLSYNTLVRYDPLDPVMSRVEPDLADRWDLSPDGLTYTFHLRKGVRFHDGTELTAQDALASLQKIAKPPQGMLSPRRGIFEPVEKMEATDGYTLRVAVKRPYPSFLNQLAQGWNSIYSKGWLEAGHDPGKEVMGTGPFRLKEYIHGVSYEAERFNEYFRQGLPYLDGVKVFIIPDRGTAVAAFRTGQIMEYGPEAEDARKLQQELGDRITRQDTFGWGGSFINLSVARKPFDDVRVRQALSLALDRRDFIKIVSAGENYLQAMMPGKGAWALPEEELVKLPGYGPDIEKSRAEARRLLAEAGLPGGFSAKLGVRRVAGAEDSAIVAKDHWAKIGVTATLDIQETATAYTNMEQGTYDLFIWGTAYALDDPDAVYSEHYTCDGPRNYSRVCVADLDALYQKQTVTLDPAERRKIVWEMDKLAANNVSKIIVQGSQGRRLQWNFVRDFVAQPNRYNNLHNEAVWLAR